MSFASKYITNVHCNSETYECDVYGFCFWNTNTIRLMIKRNSNFLHLKKWIESYIGSGLMSQSTYQNPIYLENSQCKFYPLKVRDDEDVEYIFFSHEHSGWISIELYITLVLCYIYGASSSLTQKRWKSWKNPTPKNKIKFIDKTQWVLFLQEGCPSKGPEAEELCPSW